jgi:predicted site-specific integrase-resolvase
LIEPRRPDHSPSAESHAFGSFYWSFKTEYSTSQIAGYTKPKTVSGIVMRIGYARVSTKEQSFNLQVDALNAAGCDKIYTEAVSGARTERPVLNELLCNIRSGDVLVIWKLDRLGRSLAHLVELVKVLIDKGVGLQSLHDPVDTTTSQGRLPSKRFWI